VVAIIRIERRPRASRLIVAVREPFDIGDTPWAASVLVPD
jgi:hypothetical protein